MAFARLEHVSFSYSFSAAPALKDVTLTIPEGQLCGVVGTNGSGKTTLCQLLRGIVPFFHEGDLEGLVEIDGTSLAEWDRQELATTIGCVFENPFTQISGIKETVFEEIAFGLENLGVPRDQMIERICTTIDRLDLWSIAHKNPNDLSGGQRQKVAFASIVAMDTKALVIDEPTSQLDPEASEAIFGVIADLRAQGKTIVLAEHKIDHLAAIADFVVVLENGEIRDAGPARSVLTGMSLEEANVPPPEVVSVSRALFTSPPLTRHEFHDRYDREVEK